MRISLVILGALLIAGIWVAHRLRRRASGSGVHDEPAEWDDEGVHIRAAGHGKPWTDEPGGVDPASDRGPDPLGAVSPEHRQPDGGADTDFGEPRIPGLDRQEPRLGVTFGDEAADFGPGPSRRADRAKDIYGVLDTDDEPTPPPPHGATEHMPAAEREASGRTRGVGRAEGLRTVLNPLAGRLRDKLSRLRRPRAEDTLGTRLDPEHEVDPDLIENPEPPDMDALGEYVSEPRVVGENPMRERQPPRAEEEKILLLHVVAPRNRPFTGVALGAALERAGLTPGELDIYHCHDSQVDNRAPLFSVANMVAPGTLRTADLADMMTPGLTLFVQVHASAQPQQAFERMLEHAHGLARDLGGSILDSQQSTATNQTLAYMREDLNQWLMRNRPDLLRRGSAR
ncbi:MAG: cell division protein ZipA [Pseudomonadota bacterium]